MSNPFHDIADEYDALSDKLREQGDAWALGTLSVGEPPPPDTPTETSSSKSSSK